MHGLLVAGGSWLVLTIILAGGWIAGGRMGVVTQDSVAAGGFLDPVTNIRRGRLARCVLVLPSRTPEGA